MSIQGDEHIFLSDGEDKLVDCGVSNSSSPTASSIDWTYNDKYISSGPTLQLRNMSKNESGVYTCIAFNGYGIPALKKFYILVDGMEETTMLPTVITESPEIVPTYDRETDKLIKGQVTDNVCPKSAISSFSQANDSIYFLCMMFCVIKLCADSYKTYSTYLPL
jgi:hypothetical protein